MLCISEAWLRSRVAVGTLFLSQNFEVLPDLTVLFHFMVALCYVDRVQFHQQKFIDKFLGYSATAPVPCLNKTIVISSLNNPLNNSEYRKPNLSNGCIQITSCNFSGRPKSSFNQLEHAHFTSRNLERFPSN